MRLGFSALGVCLLDIKQQLCVAAVTVGSSPWLHCQQHLLRGQYICSCSEDNTSAVCFTENYGIAHSNHTVLLLIPMEPHVFVQVNLSCDVVVDPTDKVILKEECGLDF